VHSFGVNFYDYTVEPLSGLWRAFSFESQTDAKTYDPTDATLPPLVKTTKSFFDPAYQAGGAQYGNLTRLEEYNGAATNGALPYRVTEHNFATRDDATAYIVDREWMTVTHDGQQRLLALSQSFYDGNNQTPQ